MASELNAETAHLWGEINAQRFILENLYAVIIAADPDPKAAAKATGEEMCRQWELRYNDPVSDTEDAIIQHGLARLEGFWARVQARLATMGK